MLHITWINKSMQNKTNLRVQLVQLVLVVLHLHVGHVVHQALGDQQVQADPSPPVGHGRHWVHLALWGQLVQKGQLDQLVLCLQEYQQDLLVLMVQLVQAVQAHLHTEKI